MAKLKEKKHRRKHVVPVAEEQQVDAETTETATNPEIDNAITSLIAEIKKQPKYKDIMIAVGTDPSLIIQKLPTDIEALDKLLGGGFPIGKMTLMYGEFSTGKTFIAQKAIKASQVRNGSSVLMDIDKGFEPSWSNTIGVDNNKLLVAQPNYGEQAFDLVIDLIKNKTDLVVMDSLDALVPTAEGEAEMDENFMGLQAKLIARGLRNVKRVNTQTVFLCLNHIRETVGQKSRFSQWHIPGGKAQEDMSSVMMWFSRGPQITEDEIKQGGDPKKRVGFKMKITLEKDKIHGRRYDSCELPFLFGNGAIDTAGGLVEVCIDAGVIRQAGAWYYFNFSDEKVAGKVALKKRINEDPDFKAKLTEALGVAEVK